MLTLVNVMQNLDQEGISFCCRTTYDDNAITNAVEIFNTSSGAVHFIASINDSGVREYDMERYQLCKHFRFDWPVNHTSLSPDGKLVLVVGDDPDALLIDANSGKAIHSMKGHLDFSFASAWSPDGRTFATGNQDRTCRVWDARNLSQSLHVLRGNLGAIRSIRYTSDALTRTRSSSVFGTGPTAAYFSMAASITTHTLTRCSKVNANKCWLGLLCVTSADFRRRRLLGTP
uniref:Uncharacterized protein n=2 Tax=Aegilops tauschii subsp. strangulata TaxID=200361 RepID=A0A453REA8_AEGTS